MGFLNNSCRYLKRFFKKANEKIERLIILFIVFLAGLVFSVISVVNHERFLTFGWDLGFYDQIVWLFSNFQFPFSTFLNMPALAGRFAPILALLAPFYWFYPDAKVLLLTQAILAAASAYIIYKLSKLLTKSGYSSIVVALSFLAFVGLQRAVFFDFHTDIILAFLISLALFSAVSSREHACLSFCFLALLTKEWVGILITFIGVMFLIQGKKKLGKKMIVLGILGFIITIYGIMIPLGGLKAPILDYGELGNTPHQAVINLAKSPFKIVSGLILPFEKIKTVFASFWPFAFLPFFSPSTLIPIFTQFAVRFLDETHKQSWTLLYHYSASLAPLLAFGAAMGIANIKKQKLATHILLLTSILGMIVFHAPLFSILKSSFYFEQQWIKDNRELLLLIPADVAVAAQNNIAPHLSSRNNIYTLPLVSDAQFIAVDFHEPQSSYNFHPGTKEEVENVVDDLLEKDLFYIKKQIGDAILLKRK